MQIVRIEEGSKARPSAEIIGAKAANLAHMASLDLPVPPAFVLPIELCAAIIKGDPQAKRELMKGLREGVEFLESVTGRKLGGRRSPLLVSVRSGAARSMPGMLETVLNVGCTLSAVHGLVRLTGHPKFAFDCRRRFLESYGSVVLGLDSSLFAKQLAGFLAVEGAGNEHALDSEAIEQLGLAYQQMIEGEDCLVPEDPMEQLEAAAQAIYRSWASDRASTYRRLEHLEYLQGTAVTIQAMVYGNRGLSSGAGVAFSRDPSTGAAKPVIDFLFESQGEDVVSGSRDPETESAIARSTPALELQLRQTLAKLEQEFADVQDVEFTIEEGQLWILQTRAAKRTPLAALRFAIDFVNEKRITSAEALQRLEGLKLDALESRHMVDAGAPAAQGTGASAGIAVGRVAFDTASAERITVGGDPVILMRPDTNTADVAGFAASSGIVTAVGGRTAHAALVARQMGKPCIVGCAALSIDVAGKCGQLGKDVIHEGDWLSLNGETGAIYAGRCEIVSERPEAELAEVERWRRHHPKSS
ncbi:MAG: PEP-utilizing enzyme [Alphaproteobacteria bacterium]|nr:PEP-utilizing enzyme [Alphaproteobacteria bacterium]